MDGLRPHQRGALATAAASVVAVVVLSWDRSEQADHTLVAFAWLIGMASLLLAAGVADSFARLRTWRPNAHGLAATAIVVAAFVLRTAQLDRFPRVVDADGASFALVARDIAAGRVRDPFTTGYLDHPILWSYGQRTVMAFTGETLGGARTLSALVGTAAVAATIVWGRRLGGWTVGLLAGAFLAASPMHLHFSRLALNNVTDSLALPLVLVLLDRGVVAHRRPAAVGAGLVVGLAQYGYLGARVLVPIVVLVACILLLRAHRRGELRTATRLLEWTGIGIGVAIAPLAVHYVGQPADLTARDEHVSIFAGWLGDEAERTGDPQLQILAEQAVRAVLLPALEGHETYHPPVPLVGWPLLLASAVGAGVMLARWNRHHAALAVAWVVPLAAVGTTVGLASHRWVIGTPVVAVTAAIGVVAIARVLAAMRPGATDRLVGAAVLVVALAVGAVHTAGFFREGAAVAQHGDLNSLVATELARDLAAEAPGTQVLLGFAPRMSARTHATIPFLVPHVDVIDLPAPLTSATDVPAVPTGTIFAFLPERLAELDIVRQRYPGGDERTVAAFGHDLYTTYRVATVER